MRRRGDLADVLVEPDWAADLEDAFAGLPVLRVGVLCPLAVAESSTGTWPTT